ncbi:hypothetical protein B0H10DRAFT_493448 [Mycena sp. CBHHK59/15]|nr:hypothetical protein B0H10DRAFT_493448 [Mycena sp. CBHHK59/15]
MTLSIGSALLVAVLALPACALPSPTPRDNAPAMASVMDLTESAIMDFLKTKNVEADSFSMENSWKGVDFAGASADNMTLGHINSIMYSLFDRVPDPSPGNNANSTLWFSTEYINFIQDVNTVTPSNSSMNNTQLLELQSKQAALCGAQTALLKKAIEEYLGATGLSAISGTNDPGLREWASTEYTPLVTANTECAQATDAYYQFYDTLLGDNFAVFYGMSDIIRGITDPKVGYHPGVNMPIDQPLGSEQGSQALADYVPEYYVPVLNGTLASWQQTILAGGTPSFSYVASSNDFSGNSTTTSGGGGFSFVWDDFSGSGSGSGSTTTANAKQQASAFTMGFGSITLMDIERGAWFDGFRMASAANNPPKNDNVTALIKPIFDRYFGTSSAPGPASAYKTQVLVAYQPSWQLTLTSSSDYTQLKSAAAGVSTCFLFFCKITAHRLSLQCSLSA